MFTSIEEDTELVEALSCIEAPLYVSPDNGLSADELIAVLNSSNSIFNESMRSDEASISSWPLQTWKTRKGQIFEHKFANSDICKGGKHIPVSF